MRAKYSADNFAIVRKVFTFAAIFSVISVAKWIDIFCRGRVTHAEFWSNFQITPIHTRGGRERKNI